MKKRVAYEERNMGGYSLIYPCGVKSRQKRYNLLQAKMKRLIDLKKEKVVKTDKITKK